MNAASGLVLDRAAAAARVEAWRAAGESVVFTNGVFDLVHRGHVASLTAARGKGDRLVVGVNDDDSVRRLKGPRRPLAPLEDRMAVLAALRAVDLVTPFAEDTPEELIRALRPVVLVKGADYKVEDVVGGAFVRSYGGRVETVDLVPGRSTSSVIERVLERYGKSGDDTTP